MKIKDKKVKEIIMKMPQIPPAIQEAALKEYLYHASFLQAVAFMQWRLMFPQNVGTKRDSREALKGMIMNHIKHTYKGLAAQSTHLPDVKYTNTEKQYKKFELAIFPGSNFNVRTFDQVGMINPFPIESKDFEFTIPSAPLDLVYAKSRYV